MDTSTNKAYEKAIKLLSKQDYSQLRLREKLKGVGMDEDQIDSAIDRLIDKNFLKEQNYINQFIRKHMRKGFSISYIGKKLERENIKTNREDIENIFAEEELTHNKQIKFLIDKKMPPNFRPPANRAEKQKLMKKLLGYLVSKGHDIDDGVSYLETYLFK